MVLLAEIWTPVDMFVCPVNDTNTNQSKNYLKKSHAGPFLATQNAAITLRKCSWLILVTDYKLASDGSNMSEND